MKKILVTRLLPPHAQARLEAIAHLEIVQWKSNDQMPRHELMSTMHDKDGVLLMLTDKVDAELIRNAPNLKAISTMSVGFDHIDLNACKNISIFNTPNVLTEATSELAIALILVTIRKIIPAVQSVKDGTWGTWSPIGYCGYQLQNKTVGIIGMGRIGISVAEKLVPFKCRLIYHSRAPKPILFPAEYVSLSKLILQSDVIVIACSLNSQTRFMINEEQLMGMKKDAILINIARGSIIDQEALLGVLERGHLGAVGLDVTDPEPLPKEHPLLAFPNVTVFPHIGSATLETREAMASLALDQLLNHFKV